MAGSRQTIQLVVTGIVVGVACLGAAIGLLATQGHGDSAAVVAACHDLYRGGALPAEPDAAFSALEASGNRSGPFHQAVNDWAYTAGHLGGTNTFTKSDEKAIINTCIPIVYPGK
ncbi:MAG: hypothetical protein ACRDZQ_10940 [Acidimicrobiales bacterium]